MRFISCLDSEGKSHLSQYLFDTSLLADERIHFTIILLSSEYLMPISGNTVKKWFDRYDRGRFARQEYGTKKVCWLWILP